MNAYQDESFFPLKFGRKKGRWGKGILGLGTYSLVSGREVAEILIRVGATPDLPWSDAWQGKLCNPGNERG